MLTPFEQAKRYSSELPYSKRPRWIVTSNFQSFYIYDMEKPGVIQRLSSWRIWKKNTNKNYHFVDTLAIIQDVAFKLEEVPAPKLHWWNKFGIWLSTLWRK